MAARRLSEEDRRAIAEAVGRVEAATDGEIICILSPRSDDYAEAPVGWAAAAAFLLPLLAVLAGWRPMLPLPWLHAWEAGAPALRVQLVEAVGAYAAVQAVLFGVLYALLRSASLRPWLVPGGLKRAKVRAGAASQYLATGLSAAADRTGVLVYASLEERMVEVIADRLISEKAGPGVWEEAVAAVREGMRGGVLGGGFVRAVEIAGAVLAEHFPPTRPRANAFSDEVREL